MRGPVNAYLRSLLLVAAPLCGQQPADFHAQAHLVLLPFHVTRDKYYVSDLKPSDIILLEDGKQRPFSIFEGPATETGTFELVLLFDTTLFGKPKTAAYPPDDFYDFARGWDESRSHAILGQGKASVQASVYRFASDRLQRICLSTADPRQLLAAVQQLREPVPANEAVTLSPSIDPATRHAHAGELWTFAAIDSILKDPYLNSDHAVRSLVVFSTGADFAGSSLDGVSRLAADRGISIYPVVFNAHMPSQVRNARGTLGDIAQPTRQIPFRRLADLTGGVSFDVTSIDANRLHEILESIKNEGLSQYLIALTPPAGGSASPKEHRLEIRLVSKSTGKLIGGTRTATY